MTRSLPVLLVLVVLLAPALVPAAEPAKPVTFTINGATTQPISPYMYGTNMPDWQKHRNLTLCRWGGYRITDIPVSQLDDLLPDRWQRADQSTAVVQPSAPTTQPAAAPVTPIN